MTPPSWEALNVGPSLSGLGFALAGAQALWAAVSQELERRYVALGAVLLCTGLAGMLHLPRLEVAALVVSLTYYEAREYKPDHKIKSMLNTLKGAVLGRNSNEESDSRDEEDFAQGAVLAWRRSDNSEADLSETFLSGDGARECGELEMLMTDELWRSGLI